MPRFAWFAVNASDLIEASDDGSLGDLLPSLSAIYLWRRKLVAPSAVLSSGDDLREWLLTLTSQPAARLKRRPLAHCVWADGIQVGGGGLTQGKEKTLDARCEHRAMRELLVSFVEALSEFTPPIYIGQAVNLRRRVSQHLQGETGLMLYIQESLGLSWEDLELRYLVLSRSAEVSEEARALQELLELIAQRVLAPFATDRPG